MRPASLRNASRALWAAITAIAAVRLASLAAYPLMDTTESRYAEIARRMAAHGDWVTPWVGDGVPFWGKPPLSFWMTALGFEALGLGEFAARLPHFLCGLLAAWVLWDWIARHSRRQAALAVAMLAGSFLYFAAAGTVMTDMALALGTTLVMRGFWLGLHGPRKERSREQALLFLGLAIGLLAKGPIALITLLPIAVWALAEAQVARAWRVVPWMRGAALTLALAAPWYAVAEARTPGFLEYFLVGEHWQRFVESGWDGDLYGRAHDFPRGTIWLFALFAFAPWTVVLPMLAWRRRGQAVPAEPDERALRSYLWGWAIAPCVVFMFAGNILWTYVLPGIPALAYACALWLDRLPAAARVDRVVAGGVALTAIGAVVLVAGFHLGGWTEVKSAKAVVAQYESRREPGEALVFFRHVPLSAEFYSRGRAELVREPAELASRLGQGPAIVAVRERHRARLPAVLVGGLEALAASGDYRLYRSCYRAGVPNTCAQ